MICSCSWFRDSSSNFFSSLFGLPGYNNSALSPYASLGPSARAFFFLRFAGYLLAWKKSGRWMSRSSSEPIWTELTVTRSLPSSHLFCSYDTVALLLFELS